MLYLYIQLYLFNDTILINNAMVKNLNKVGNLQAESTIHGVIKMPLFYLSQPI